jgi:NAD(P)-dependent dehydrogenase (short-subunit alcohol dehydrogenase family)
MGCLDHKVAIITGGTGGIGLATARLFVAEGARVVLVDLDRAVLADAVATLGAERAHGVQADVADPGDAERYVAATLERHGRVDVLFANAGIEGAVSALVDYPLETFDRVMSVNVRGVWLALKQTIPPMARGGGGSIVLTSSLAGLRGMQKVSAYVASKHAVVGLMRAAALECAPLGIRVNTINPAPIATRMIEALEAGFAQGETAVVRRKIQDAVPLRRYGTPDEVARLALFLASDASSYITGNAYPIDGGMSAR